MWRNRGIGIYTPSLSVSPALFLFCPALALNSQIQKILACCRDKQLVCTFAGVIGWLYKFVEVTVNHQSITQKPNPFDKKKIRKTAEISGIIDQCTTFTGRQKRFGRQRTGLWVLNHPMRREISSVSFSWHRSGCTVAAEELSKYVWISFLIHLY